jgi:hypothetical protein
MRPFGHSKSVNAIRAEVVVHVGLFAALVLALLVSPSTGRATTIHPLPLSRALRAVAAPTVPSEWAGIWSFADTIRDCNDPRIITPLNVGLDTLCAGAAYGPDTMQFVCSGGFTDTGFDITCTGTQSVHVSCSLAITSHLQGTRNGDVVTTFRTSTWVYTPTDCDSFPDGCVVTAGFMTYVGPPPTDCATTPVRTSSWGSLKLRYR